MPTIFFKKEFSKYRLFKPINKEAFFRKLHSLFKTSAPLALQSLAEWGNLAIISTLISSFGINHSIANQIIVTLLTSYYIVTFSQAQAGSVLVANELGKAKKAIESNANNKQSLAETHMKNIRQLGNASSSLGLMASLALGTLFISIPDQITSFFLSLSGNDTLLPQIADTSRTFLIINGAGLFADTLRTTESGNLRGFDDIFVPTLISLIFMSVFALGAGSGLSLTETLEPYWIYILREIAIVISTLIIGQRRLAKSKSYSSAIDRSVLHCISPEDKLNENLSL